MRGGRDFIWGKKNNFEIDLQHFAIINVINPTLLF